jgi:hypothetical protein
MQHPPAIELTSAEPKLRYVDIDATHTAKETY